MESSSCCTNIHSTRTPSGKNGNSKDLSQAETLRQNCKMWELRNAQKGAEHKRKTTMKKHFLVVFSFPELFPIFSTECLPISIIHKQTENRYGFTTSPLGIASYMQTWATPALQACWPGTVHNRWEYYKCNKRISFPDSWLKAFLCGKVGCGNGRIDWKKGDIQ